MGIFFVRTCQFVLCKSTWQASAAREISEVKLHGAIESPKFSSRKPRKGSHRRESALYISTFGKEKFCTFKPIAIRDFTSDHRRPKCYIPLLSCNIHGSVCIEFNRNHLPRLRSISSVQYIEGTIRLRIMHTAHTRTHIGWDTYAAFAYASRERVCIYMHAEDGKGEMVNDSIQPTVTAHKQRYGEFYWQRFDSTNFIRT